MKRPSPSARIGWLSRSRCCFNSDTMPATYTKLLLQSVPRLTLDYGRPHLV